MHLRTNNADLFNIYKHNMECHDLIKVITCIDIIDLFALFPISSPFYAFEKRWTLVIWFKRPGVRHRHPLVLLSNLYLHRLSSHAANFLCKLDKILCITGIVRKNSCYSDKVEDMSEIHPLLTLTPDAKLGPCMRALNERQRAFVIALIEMGGINFSRAAFAAGYGNGNVESASVQGHRLAHDETILAAIHEEAHRRLRSGAVMAVQTLLEIANDQTAKHGDRLKAVEMLLNRSGLHAVTEHNIKVERHDVTDEGMIKRITLLAQKQGLDPAKLLGSAGVVLEGEFQEVSKDKTVEEIFELSREKRIQPEDDLSDLF